MSDFAVRVTTERKELKRWLRAADRLALDYTLRTILVDSTDFLGRESQVDAWELRLHHDESHQEEEKK